MCQRTIFPRSCRRMAEEAQLRAEEEFMVEALKMIKQQRNCLQIERLHLESLKQQLLNPEKTKKGKKHSPKPGTSTEGLSEAGTSKGLSLPTPKPTEMMSAVDMMNLGSKQREDDFSNLEDMLCNNQQLNLNLSFDASTSAAGTSKATYPSQYDYNSDEPSSEESDGDNVMIDMNMLMNSTRSK